MDATLTVFHPLPPGEHVDAFVGDPLAWLPAATRPAVPPNYRTELTVGRFSRPVELHLGGAWRRGHDHWRALSWTPLSDEGDALPVEALLPRFEGELGLIDGRDGGYLVVTGLVLPPMGAAGVLLERALLHRVGERTVGNLLAEVVERLGQPAALNGAH